ncbi:MAG: hypothetical protein M1835_006091 [Candelina submexicana]|nr:MAG: hypothetical protein M1835_006091 [Candelina submexicana]
MAQKRSRAAYEADLQAQQSPHVIYGTPLPPLDPNVRDDGSYVPVWKQEVTDERGRKRLHGAFTGGFSAGYFNTVGSKEGWAPSTFVSSRAEKKNNAEKTAQQRPEDFMDEEDLADAAEAQRLQESQAFTGLGSTEAEMGHRAGLMDILRTRGETMGTKLLKRMGWKEGQGVGPKIRRQARLGRETQADNDPSDYHLFAPENSPMIAFHRKTDRKGLGYESEVGLSDSVAPDKVQRQVDEDDGGEEDRTMPHLRANGKSKNKRSSARGGFGVGILNDTGLDDDDPYEIGPRVSYNRVIGSEKKKQSKKALANSGLAGSAGNPLLRAKPIFISKKSAMAKSASSLRRCHDGRLPLDGFVLPADPDNLSASVSQDGNYPPPKIPDDWKSSKAPTTTRDIAPYRSTADAAKASKLDPKSRASLLGEAQLPGKSVFDYLNTSARDRIASASGKSNLPQALGEAPPKGFSLTTEEKEKQLWGMLPKLDKDVAIKALGRGVGGWMPYGEDEAKRARYRAFLEGQAGLRAGLPERESGVSKGDWLKELNEFAHAAQIFKPMTGAMATRFTTSSTQPKLASDVPDTTEAQTLLTIPAKKQEDPAEAAAKVGMYGPITRSSQQFFPTRLLCKRFNVKPPDHVQLDPDQAPQDGTAGSGGGGAENRFTSAGFQTSSAAPSKGKLELVSKVTMDELRRDSARQQRNGADGVGVDDATDSTAEQRQSVTVDPERNEALEGKRAGDAVFKAIFGSDDEDDDVA